MVIQKKLDDDRADTPVLQFEILPRENTLNVSSTSPAPLIPKSQEKTKFGDKIRSIFSKNKDLETSLNSNKSLTLREVTDVDDAGYNTDSDKHQTKNKSEDYANIRDVDGNAFDSKRSSKMSKNDVTLSSISMATPVSRNTTDEYEMRNVNESSQEFYEKTKDGVVIASHSSPQENSNSEIEEEKKQQLKEKAMSILKYCIKQSILVGLVLAYAIGGAYLFALLEVRTVQKNCQESKGQDIANIVTTKAKLIEYVQYNVTSNVLDTSKDNETYAVVRIEEMLTEFRDNVLNIGYGGEDCEKTKWVIINGILFCLTIVTTIGYGQVFPITWEGQIVCICYATIGIPLFVVCLTNISSVLGYLFRWSYVKICCGVCNYRKKRKEEKAAANYADPHQSAISKNVADGTEARVVDDNEDLMNEINEKDDIENASVPLTVTIMVVTGYIVSGAILFHFTDGFGYIESAYFCFVTLTTIGFGDLVPGQDFTDPLGPYKLAAGCAYILIGLSVLGMAFDLMQEELISKFSWFGKKIGLIDPDEEEQDSEKEKDNEKDKDDMIKKENSDYGQMQKVHEK